jgi:hypothetical protein
LEAVVVLHRRRSHYAGLSLEVSNPEGPHSRTFSYIKRFLNFFLVFETMKHKIGTSKGPVKKKIS